MKFIVGIVTYNPSIDELVNSIKVISSMGYEIIIVDNGSDNINDIENFIGDNCYLIKNDDNLGIAKALNQVFYFSDKMGYKWVLTLDQDSMLSYELLCCYGECMESSKVGIYCPRVHDLVSGVTWPKDGLIELDKCITSGSLTSVCAWQDIAGFDEYLFIDEVDNDFCYRLRKMGYKIVVIPSALLNHKVGKTRIVNFFGKRIYVRNHSSMRKFYITRNRLYLDRKYYGHIRATSIFKTLLFIVKTFIFEDDKKAKLMACLSGVKESIRNKC